MGESPPGDPYARVARELGASLVSHAPLHGGVSADVRVLELREADGGRRHIVVRQHGAAKWKELPAQVTTNEYGVLRVLADLDLPVPRPLMIDTSCKRLPAPYLVLPFIKGEAEPTNILTGARHIAVFLARLHALEPAELQLPSQLPTRSDPRAELRQYLAPRYAHVHALLSSDASFTPAPARLLHGDVWPGNMLWHGDTICAVLDWEDVALGDPAADVAGCRVELLWKYGHEAADAFVTAYDELAQLTVSARQRAWWELLVVAGAFAFMHEWGLDPATETRMRERGEAVLEAASAQVSTN